MSQPQWDTDDSLPTWTRITVPIPPPSDLTRTQVLPNADQLAQHVADRIDADEVRVKLHTADPARRHCGTCTYYSGNRCHVDPPQLAYLGQGYSEWVRPPVTAHTIACQEWTR